MPGRSSARRPPTRLKPVIACVAIYVHLSAGFCAASGPITLEFWDFPHLPRTNDYLTSAMARFQAEHPGVRIRYTKLPWQDGQQKLTLSVLSGSPPDVCGQVSTGLPGFIAQDVLEPLESYLQNDISDFHPAYLKAVSHKGHVYAVPWYKACYVMLLNLDLFKKFGVAPPKDGRWNWDEFLVKMKALTRTSAGDRATTSAEPNFYGLVTNLGPMEYEAYSIIFNFGGRILQQRPEGIIQSTVAEAPFIEGLRRLQSLEFEHRVAAPGIGAATQEQSWSLWRDSRTCACTIQGAWCVTAVERANDAIEATNRRKVAAGRTGELEKPIRWMIAAPPQKDSMTTPVLASSGLGTYVVFRQKDPERRRLAAEFALYLVSGEGQRVLKYENVYPSRISAGDPFADDPRLSAVFSLFPDGVMSPLVPGGERIDRVLQQEVQKAVLVNPGTGNPQATVEQAAKAADTKIRAVLERAKRRFGNL
ncbi:MAG: ABC transporter substrate-binding protein [Candidatus Sumerlaeaceae bacterium]